MRDRSVGRADGRAMIAKVAMKRPRGAFAVVFVWLQCVPNARGRGRGEGGT